MKLNIGKIIGELRKRDRITQEKLAQALGVSVAAVSKWETGSTYPDITVLPAIARYFKTTVDTLMGYEENCSDEQFLEIINTTKRLFAQDDFDKAIAYCEDYMRQYPTSLELKFCMVSLYVFNKERIADDEVKSQKLKERVIQLYEDCSRSENKEIQNGTYVVLSNLYRQNKEYEKAKAVLAQLPRLQLDPDGTLASILLEEGKKEQVSKIGTDLLKRSWDNLMKAFSVLADEKRASNDYAGALQILKKQNNLMDAMEFDVPSRLENKFNHLKVYAKAQRREDVIRQLKEVVEEVRRVKEAQVQSEKNIPAGAIDLGMDALNYIVFVCLKYMKENEDFMFIRSNEEVVSLMKILENMV